MQMFPLHQDQSRRTSLEKGFMARLAAAAGSRRDAASGPRHDQAASQDLQKSHLTYEAARHTMPINNSISFADPHLTSQNALTAIVNGRTAPSFPCWSHQYSNAAIAPSSSNLASAGQYTCTLQIAPLLVFRVKQALYHHTSECTSGSLLSCQTCSENPDGLGVLSRKSLVQACIVFEACTLQTFSENPDELGVVSRQCLVQATQHGKGLCCLGVDIAAARQSAWCGAADSQQILCFSNLQGHRLKKVSNNSKLIHGVGLDNSVPGLDGNSLVVNSSKEQVVMAGGLLPPLEARLPALPSSSRVQLSDAFAKSSTAQLTIFYDGQVNVYNVSSAKAQDIILMAAAGGLLPEDTGLPAEKSAQAALPHVNAEHQEWLHIDLNTQEHDQFGATQVVVDSKPSNMMQEDQADSFIPGSNTNLLEEEPVVPRALPQARKASLARFLERRKERLMSRLPYPVEKSFI